MYRIVASRRVGPSSTMLPALEAATEAAAASAGEPSLNATCHVPGSSGWQDETDSAKPPSREAHVGVSQPQRGLVASEARASYDGGLMVGSSPRRTSKSDTGTLTVTYRRERN